jgi:hypothetical protein
VDDFLSSWCTEKTLSPVEDFFNDKLDFKCLSFKDLDRLNTEILPVARKFKLFECSKGALDALRLFLTNYEVIQVLLGEIEAALQDQESQLEEHQERINKLNDEVRECLVHFEEANKQHRDQKEAKRKEITELATLQSTFVPPKVKSLGKHKRQAPAPPPIEGLAQPFAENICGWLPGQKFILLYRATRDGSAAANFHSCCNNKGATLVVIQSRTGHIFGGYNSVGWRSAGGYAKDPCAFLFTLTNPHNLPPTKFNTKSDGHEIYNGRAIGPTFGHGHDLHVSGQGNHYFDFPNTYEDCTGKGKVLFTGEEKFQIHEIEVFAVTF